MEEKNEPQKPSMSSQLWMKEAEVRGWKTISFKNNIIMLYPPNEREILIQNSATELGTGVGAKIAKHKLNTQRIAEHYGIPMPETSYYNPKRMDSLYEFLKKHKRVVVKPVDRAHGTGVTTSVFDIDTLHKAINHAKLYSSKIIVQQYVPGVDYRVLVVSDTVIAAALRRPPFVIGDGTNSVRQLIKTKNCHPWRGVGREKPLTLIKIDEVTNYIGHQKLEQILSKGEELELLGTANISKGGEAFDVTDVMHPALKELATRISNACHLSVCGVDFRCAGDATKDINVCKPMLLEINSSPGLRMHHFPSNGPSRNVTSCILDEILRKRNIMKKIQMMRDKPLIAPLCKMEMISSSSSTSIKQ